MRKHYAVYKGDKEVNPLHSKEAGNFPCGFEAPKTEGVLVAELANQNFLNESGERVSRITSADENIDQPVQLGLDL